MEINLYRLPFREPDDIARLIDIVRSNNVFVPGFCASDSDIYHPFTYLDQQTHHNTKTILVADRNLVSHWTNLVKGNTPTTEGQCASAVMAFAQCSDIMIEPSIALYEYAFSRGNDTANDDLYWFRVADNTDVLLWLDIALGRRGALETPHIGSSPIPKPGTVDFEMPLRRWRRNYVLCLKVAELALLNGDGEKRFKEFLRWMHDEYLIGACAILFAMHYLAPNSSRKGLLKGIRSEDRDKAIKGVKNATWDMTLLSEWALACTQSSKNNEIRILATLDRRLRVLAESMLEYADNGASDALRKTVNYYWGAEAGRRILSQLLEYDTTRDCPLRKINQPYASAFIDSLILAGEDRLRNWKPSR